MTNYLVCIHESIIMILDTNSTTGVQFQAKPTSPQPLWAAIYVIEEVFLYF